MDSFLKPHIFLYKNILIGFLLLIPVTQKSNQKLHSPVRPRLYQGNHFSTFFKHVPFKNYPAKVDCWLEKLNRQNYESRL